MMTREEEEGGALLTVIGRVTKTVSQPQTQVG